MEITMNLLIGSDPELFIRDNKTGKLISAHGLFPGTKEEPYAVRHGAIQVDGMAAEYNIHPASTAEEFVFFHLSVLCDLRDEIKARNPDLDFSFAFIPVADFGAEYIAEQPMEAKQLGCTPDFNAWEDGAINPTPDADMPFRTASGHIHLGWGSDYDTDDPEHIEACCMMVKQIDASLAPVYVLQEGVEGKRRRDLYGKAGAFRPKKYGVEYRVLSNVWLTNTYYMENIFNSVQNLFEGLLGGYKAYDTGWAAKSRQYIDEYNEYKLEGNWGRFDPLYWGHSKNQPVTMETLDKLRAQWEAKAALIVHEDDLMPIPDMDGEDDIIGQEIDVMAVDEFDDFDDQPDVDDVPEEWIAFEAGA
jgi:hypothetical protein